MITPAFAASPVVLLPPGMPPPSLKLVAATVDPLQAAAPEKAVPSSGATARAAEAAGGAGCLSAGEWDDLFGAVVVRLAKAVTDPGHVPTGPFLIGGAPTLTAVVLECADAMDKLRLLLAQQRQAALFSPVGTAAARQPGEPGHGPERPDHQRM